MVLELVGLTEAAGLMSISKQRLSQLSVRQDFPSPVAELKCGKIWLKEDILKFDSSRSRRNGRPPVGRKPAPDSTPETEPYPQMVIDDVLDIDLSS